MKDIKITADGDFALNSLGDLDYVEGDDALLQVINFRLRTVKGDWILSPQVGADLERFIGSPLRDDTLLKIQRSVERELTNVPEIKNLSVAVAPMGESTIIISVSCDSINQSNSELSVVYTLDLLTGMVVDRGNTTTPNI